MLTCPGADSPFPFCVFFVFLGLRTLCIAVADIKQEFYEDWKHTYYKASTSIQNREQKLEEAAELIERVCLLLPFHCIAQWLVTSFLANISDDSSLNFSSCI